MGRRAVKEAHTPRFRPHNNFIFVHSLPFDERAWILDLPAKEETVLQSSGFVAQLVSAVPV